jgi:hypothetical protein
VRRVPASLARITAFTAYHVRHGGEPFVPSRTTLHYAVMGGNLSLLRLVAYLVPTSLVHTVRGRGAGILSSHSAPGAPWGSWQEGGGWEGPIRAVACGRTASPCSAAELRRWIGAWRRTPAPPTLPAAPVHPFRA